jgi:hypothetical protein
MPSKSSTTPTAAAAPPDEFEEAIGEEKERRRVTAAAATSSAMEEPCTFLPPLLLYGRWQQDPHDGAEASTPGYIDAARVALLQLRRIWKSQQQQQRLLHAQRATPVVQAVEAERFATDVTSFLREAHVEALLVLAELTLAPPWRAGSEGDTTVSQGFSSALLSCVLQLMCLRHAEVAGRHMAQLSRLLLSSSHLLRDAAQHTAVWDSFALLCYASRRRLRRRPNRNCLEALLWGLFYPRNQHEGRQGGRDAALAAVASVESCPPQRQPSSSSLRATQTNRMSFLARNRAGTRRAALHHLLYRCLERETVAESDLGAAAAHTDLLLSWALCIAGSNLEPTMRDAIVHRLCKSFTPAHRAAETTVVATLPSPPSVQQWQQLALRCTEAQIKSGDDGRHGKHGKVLLPGNEVFAAVEREARRTGGWAVLAADKDLLALLCSTQLPAMVRWNVTTAETTQRERAATTAAPTAASEREWRLAEAASATLRAYARLRWDPTDDDDTLRCKSVKAAEGATASIETPPPPLRVLRLRQRSIELEVEELMHTAWELPRPAWCLSEAIAVRLVRCLRRHRACAAAVATAASLSSSTSSSAPHASLPATTSLTRRQLLAAFRRVARHSRTDVLMYAVVLQGAAAATAAVPSRGYTMPLVVDTDDDPLSLAAFTAEATRLLVGRLFSAADAAQLVEQWWRERAAAATSLHVDVLDRLHNWVSALPPSLRSQKLAALLLRVAQLETSLPCTPSLMKRHSAVWSTEDAATVVPVVAAAKRTWEAIVAAAQPHPSVAPLPVSTSTASTAIAADALMCMSSNSPAKPPSYSAGMNTTAPQTRILLRRLQWVALLNDSPRREWRWSGVWTNAASRHHGWATTCAAVEAAEAENEMTAAERRAVEEVCGCRCASDKDVDAMQATPWIVVYERRWLETLLATACASPLTTDPQSSAPANAVDSAAALHSVEEPLPMVGVPPSLLPVYELLFKVSKPSHSLTGVLVAGGAHPVDALPGSVTAGCCDVPPAAETHLFVCAHYDEALRLLALYGAHLVKHLDAADSETRRTAEARKLWWVASAAVLGLIDFWKAYKRASGAPAPRDAFMPGPEALCEHYQAVVQLLHAMAQKVPTCSLFRSNAATATTAAFSPLPSLPEDLHLDVFSTFTLANTPDWQRCEALLLLVDDVAACGATAACNPGSTATPVSNTNATLMNAAYFQVPLRVYAEVVAVYAAHQRPMSQRLRERCTRQL